jgi:hypothetical protein
LTVFAPCNIQAEVIHVRLLAARKWLISLERCAEKKEDPMFKGTEIVSGILTSLLIVTLSIPLLAADAGEKAKKEALKSEVKSDRKEIQGDRKELRSDRKELNKDQKAMREAKKKGASKEDIKKMQGEIRQDKKEIAGDKKELRSDQKELKSDRKDLSKTK